MRDGLIRAAALVALLICIVWMFYAGQASGQAVGGGSTRSSGLNSIPAACPTPQVQKGYLNNGLSPDCRLPLWTDPGTTEPENLLPINPGTKQTLSGIHDQISVPSDTTAALIKTFDQSGVAGTWLLDHQPTLTAGFTNQLVFLQNVDSSNTDCVVLQDATASGLATALTLHVPQVMLCGGGGGWWLRWNGSAWESYQPGEMLYESSENPQSKGVTTAVVYDEVGFNLTFLPALGTTKIALKDSVSLLGQVISPDKTGANLTTDFTDANGGTHGTDFAVINGTGNDFGVCPSPQKFRKLQVFNTLGTTKILDCNTLDGECTYTPTHATSINDLARIQDITGHSNVILEVTVDGSLIGTGGWGTTTQYAAHGFVSTTDTFSRLPVGVACATANFVGKVFTSTGSFDVSVTSINVIFRKNGSTVASKAFTSSSNTSSSTGAVASFAATDDWNYSIQCAGSGCTTGSARYYIRMVATCS